MFDDLVKQGLIRCADTGEVLEEFEPWLFASAQSENLYPIMSGTPILHPNSDGFLETEIWTISRALAQWPEAGEVREWYFSRYGTIASAEVPDLDTAVRGEGYPGFWQHVEIPDFARELVSFCPEQRISSWLAGEKLGLGLDLGCGQGGMMQYMSSICERVLGLETNFYLATLANQQLPASEIPVRYLVPERGVRQSMMSKEPAPNALVLCGDVNALPFAAESFDWIHCGHFLDLVDDPITVLLNVTRLLKPGGWLTICTPWDIDEEGHFDEMPALLEEGYQQVAFADGTPWLRFNHKRRLILHEDWIWAGRRK